MAAVAEPAGDDVVGFPDAHVLEEFRNSRVVLSVFEDWAVDGEPFAEPGLVVVGSVPWGGVDEPGAVFDGDIFSGEDGVALARVCLWGFDGFWCFVDEWVFVGEAKEVVASGGGEDFDFFGVAECGDRLDEVFGEDGVVAIHADERVFEAWVDGNGEVGGQGPGGGGPDHEGGGLGGACVVGEVEGIVDGGRVTGFEIDEDGEVLAVLVFEFGFGQGGLVVDGPMNRLEGTEDDSLFDEFGEDFEGGAFVGGVHGEVGFGVVGEGEESFHLTGLEFLEFLGVFFALSANGGAACVVGECFEFGGLAALDESGHDFVFNGKPVAVPAWYEGAVVTHECA